MKFEIFPRQTSSTPRPPTPPRHPAYSFVRLFVHPTAPEDESRLLAAAVAPKIKDVEESSLTVEFITGPNLYSYAFTVDCFAREEVDGELVPLTSCSAAADSTVIPVSQEGETGKALSKVDVVVSPLRTFLLLSLVSTRITSYFSPFLVDVACSLTCDCFHRCVQWEMKSTTASSTPRDRTGTRSASMSDLLTSPVPPLTPWTCLVPSRPLISSLSG